RFLYISCVPFPYTTLFRSTAVGLGHELDGLVVVRLMVSGVHRQQLLGAVQVSKALPPLVGQYVRLIVVARLVNHDQNVGPVDALDRKSTRLNSSHVKISYA